jgi:hypothetical protein
VGRQCLWIFAVLLITALLVFRGRDAAEVARLTAFAFIFLICGAVELLKHFINRARVELIRETKQVQLQVLELHALMQADAGR